MSNLKANIEAFQAECDLFDQLTLEQLITLYKLFKHEDSDKTLRHLMGVIITREDALDLLDSYMKTER